MAKVSDDLTGLIDEWFEREAERHWGLLDGFAGALYPEDADRDLRREMDREYFARDAEQTLDRLAAEYAKGQFDSGKPGARDIAAGLATPLPEDSQRFAVLCKRVMEARGAIEEARIRWAEGDIDYKPPRPGAAAARPDTTALPPPAEAPAPGRTLEEAIGLFLDLQRRRKNPTERGISQMSGELRILTDAFGAGTPVSAVTAREAGRIYEALQFLPKNFRKASQLAGLGFFGMAGEARRLGLPPLHGRTINGYLSTMRALFEQERKAGHAKDNPFSGLHMKVRAAQESGRGFEPAEVAALFGSPLFTGSKSPHFAYDPGTVLVADWRFWTPVIGLLTGARVSEIAQLRPSDVREHEGVWVLDINSHEDKRLKNPASRRRVPVHAELVRLGLLELAAERRRAGQALLLPDRPKAVGGDHGKQIVKWMCETLLPRFGFKKRPGFGTHSFWHGMATVLRSAGVDGRTADRILGHASEGQGARYGKSVLLAMQKALNSIEPPPEVAAIPARRTGCATVPSPVRQAEHSAPAGAP